MILPLWDTRETDAYRRQKSVQRSTASGQEVNYNSPTNVSPFATVRCGKSMAAVRPHGHATTTAAAPCPSLLSAVPSNGPTQLDTALANPGLGKHHTQAYPRTKSDTDAVTFLRRFRFRPELSRGSRRKLEVASRDVSHNGQNASAGEACPMSCKQTESPACGLVLCTALSKGEKFWRSGCLQSCGLVRQSERP